MHDSSPTMKRLDDQIAWYDGKSINCQRWYKRLKVLEIGLAASIPLTAVFAAPPWMAAVLGSGVVVLEGVQGVFQFSTLWITYRATCESLKHEKFLFAAKAGPYRRVSDPIVTLAERIESLVSQEHAKWVRGRLSELEGDNGKGERPDGAS